MNRILKKYSSLPQMAKASFWFLICSVLQKGISVITTPIFTRLMTSSEYGVYNVFVSWENILTIFITFNLSYGVYTQGLVKFDKDKKIFSASMQGLTICLVILWLVIYIPFREIFNNLLNMNTTYMLLMTLTIWISAVFGFWSANQRVNYNYKLLVIITILASILNPIISIALMKFIDDKVLARILGIAISYIIFYLWMFFEQLIEGKKLYSKKYWKYALRFNIPLIPHYLSQTILSSSDRIMIERIDGRDTAGIYSLAYSISLIMLLFNNALGQTIGPWIYIKIKEKKTNEIIRVAYPSLIGIAFINIVLIAFAPEVVAIFAPKEYYDSIWVIPPVAMSVYFMFAYDLFAKFEFYYEKTNLISIATAIVAIINIITNFIFIKLFGFVAAGYTTLVCYILYVAFHYYFMCKICKHNHIDNPYDLRKLIKITIVFMICGFTFLILYNYFILRYVIIGIMLLLIILKRKVIFSYVKKMMELKKERI